ncbi:toxin VasX [Marinobacter sp. NSM]|uniref:toxin VasX n=1 Tax=Marinobacter sp. NSM TaxID=3458004 RepID=UPI00403635D0
MTDTVDFSDESRDRSILRKADYDDADPKDLVLTVPKRDGGKISIPLLKHARSNIEREDYQDNTLVRIKPLAEIASNLPVRRGSNAPVHQGKGVALLRPGYLYIFREDKLWRELEISQNSQFSDIDLQAVRAEVGDPESDLRMIRPSAGQWLDDVLVPVFLQGQAVMHDFRMAYSEIQWDWAYIQKLEESAATRNARTTGVGHAWAVTSVDTLSFETGFPASRVEDAPELRHRDLGIELMIENPCDFVLSFERPGEDELCSKLAKLLENNEKQARESANILDLTCPPGADLLQHLRSQKGGVCVAIPDPFFLFRHALAQLHLAMHYLDAIDIAIKDKPLVHSAMLIRQAVFDPAPSGQSGDLANYRNAINREQLDDILETAERNHAVRNIEDQTRRLKKLMKSSSFNSVFDDYLQSPDVAACEAFLLCADNLNVLQQIPGVLKAQGVDDDQGIPGALAKWLSDESMLAKWSPGIAAATGEEGTQSSPYEQLRSLASDQTEINDQHLARLNLQALAYTEKQFQYDEESTGEQVAGEVKDAGRVGALVSGALGEWSASVLTACRRLMEDGSVEAIQVHRIMQAASANAILSDPGLAGVDLMRRGDVDPTKHTIIGVEGDGIRRGLTDFDRRQGGLLTRANDYLYADLVDRSGQVQGSTSPARASGELEEAIKKIAGNTWVYVVPAGHPEARKLSVLNVDLAKRVGAVVDGPGVSSGLVALAVFNVFLESRATIHAVKSNQDWGISSLKALGSLVDLAAASMKLSIVANEVASIDSGHASRLYKFSSRPWFDLKGWPLIGKRLAKTGAATLVRSVGLASFVAGGFAVGLNYWDMRISLARGDLDAALGHGIAVAGGLIFLSAPLMAGLLAIPGWGWVVLGMSVALGGSLYAGSVTDDLFERVLKQGPLGTHPQDSLVNLDDLAYYGQLLTLLSPVNISAQRYRDVDPDPALTNPDHPPQPDDYVITLQTPVVSRLKVLQECRPDLPTQPFKIVVQEVAYMNSRAETSNVAVGTVEQEVMLSTTPLTQIVARQSLPHESAVRFLVKRELQSSSFQSFGYQEEVSTTIRVGLQAVVGTEQGPVVFPTPVMENYEPYNDNRHGGAPDKSRSVFNPHSETLVPYWFLKEVSV